MTGRDRLLASLAPELVAALEQLVAERVAVELAAAQPADAGRAWLTLAEAADRLGCSPDAVRMRGGRRARLDYLQPHRKSQGAPG